MSSSSHRVALILHPSSAFFFMNTITDNWTLSISAVALCAHTKPLLVDTTEWLWSGCRLRFMSPTLLHKRMYGIAAKKSLLDQSWGSLKRETLQRIHKYLSKEMMMRVYNTLGAISGAFDVIESGAYVATSRWIFIFTSMNGDESERESISPSTSTCYVKWPTCMMTHNNTLINTLLSRWINAIHLFSDNWYSI